MTTTTEEQLSTVLRLAEKVCTLTEENIAQKDVIQHAATELARIADRIGVPALSPVYPNTVGDAILQRLDAMLTEWHKQREVDTKEWRDVFQIIASHVGLVHWGGPGDILDAVAKLASEKEESNAALRASWNAEQAAHLQTIANAEAIQTQILQALGLGEQSDMATVLATIQGLHPTGREELIEAKMRNGQLRGAFYLIARACGLPGWDDTDETLEAIVKTAVAKIQPADAIPTFTDNGFAKPVAREGS